MDNQSDPEFAKSLVMAQGMMRSLVKDKASYIGKFVSTETVVQATKEVLSDCGLAVVGVGSTITKGEPVDVETKGVVSTIPTWHMHTTYRVYSKSGYHEDMTFDMAVVPEKGKPLDKAIAAAATFSLGYFLRGLLQIPRVGSEQEVDERDDRGFDPERLRHSEITDRLAEHLKQLGKERYENIVGTEPPSDHEAAMNALALLEAERDRDGLIRTSKMVLKELGAKDAAGADAILAERKLPTLEAMTKTISIKELREVAATLRKAWKGE